MDWYYEINKKQLGPVEESKLNELFNSGEINSSNLIWSRGMVDWVTYGSVFKVSSSASSGAAGEFSGTGGNASNSELRAQARQALSGYWGMAALAVFLWQVVQGSVGMVPIIGPLAQLAIGGAMILGLYGFFTEIHRGGVADIGILFQGFTQFWQAMGIYLLTGLLVFLFALAVAIPGIGLLIYVDQTSVVMLEENPLFWVGIGLCVIPPVVASTIMMLRYGLIYFIARDCPELGVVGTIRESVNMMKGRKWKLFFLGLSFIGWHLLGAMALIVGLFWSSAYMFAAYAAFYDDLREA